MLSRAFARLRENTTSEPPLTTKGKPMAKTANPLAVSVTPFADIQKLTQSETAVRIVVEGNAANRAFINVAKLGLHLESMLKPGQTLGGVIIKLAKVPAGDRRRIKSTIDNARQAMRVWKELVPDGHINEGEFDRFTYYDCVAINRVMSGVAKQQLSASAVALMIHASPDRWHEDFDSLATHGETVGDRELRLAEEARKRQAAATGESTTPTESAATPPVDKSDESTSGKADTAASNNASSAVPTNDKVVQFERPTADTVLQLLRAAEVQIMELSPSEVAKVAPAIAELNELVQEQVKAAAAPSKKVAAARKAKIAKPAEKAA